MSGTVSALRGDVEAWCKSYIRAFMSFDAGAIAAHWAFPATVLQSGRLYRFEDAAAFEQNTQKLCAFYRKAGVTHTERKLDEVMALSEKVASIRVFDEMFKASGPAFVSWQAGYTLISTDNGWRAVFAVADGETEAWAALGMRLGG